jgi:NADH:ubiquinone reductase (non-electrogenic)
MNHFALVQTNRRGLNVDDHLRMDGSDGSIFAIGDCTATSYAPTAQVASQQGAYLAKAFSQMAKKQSLAVQKNEILATLELGEEDKAKLASIDKQLTKLENPRPFHYSHQGSLAYVFCGRSGSAADPCLQLHRVR